MHPWQAEMEPLRARTAQSGLVDPKRAATLSGLEFLLRIVRSEIPDPPITHTLDFHLLEVAAGRALFPGLPGFAHSNPTATVHGAWHGALLDSALARAVQTLCQAGRAYATLEFEIRCVRSLTDKTGPVRAEGKLVARGRRMATAEGRLTDAEGKLYSSGRPRHAVRSSRLDRRHRGA